MNTKKIIIVALLMLILAGCSGMSEKDKETWKAIDEITDIIIENDQA